MKVCLKKPIIGYRKELGGNEVCLDPAPRTHADVGDMLTVILNNDSHYICDSKYFPGTSIVVFPSQCCEVIPEEDMPEEFAEEKYYHVYEEHSKPNLDDPFYTAFEFGDE